MIKIDMIMLAIWMVAASALGSAGLGIFTWQYWIVMVCFFASEIRTEFVTKKGLK